MLTENSRDMLSELSAEGVEFLIVGAHALGVHGIMRSTKDFDIWLRPDPQNAQRIWRALARFGAPLSDVTPADFEKPGLIFQIGVPPDRVDLMTSISGVPVFEEAYKNRVEAEMDGIKVAVIGREEMIRNKWASGREHDITDAKNLEAGRMK